MLRPVDLVAHGILVASLSSLSDRVVGGTTVVKCGSERPKPSQHVEGCGTRGLESPDIKGKIGVWCSVEIAEIRFARRGCVVGRAGPGSGGRKRCIAFTSCSYSCLLSHTHLKTLNETSRMRSGCLP